LKILVDIGNTRTKYQVEQKGSSEIFTVENANINNAWLDEYWGSASKIIISSVKRGVLPETILTWSKGSQVKVRFVDSEKEGFGVINCYEQPETLGVDRWLSMIGAATQYPNSGLVIVDAGTATTIDVLDSSGKHLGGWILSGIDLMLKQLGQNTSKVHYDISDIANIDFGKNTSECVNNAVWAATVSLVEYGINKARQEFSISQCILLGGNAEKLFQHIKLNDVIIDQNLIFEGLKRY